MQDRKIGAIVIASLLCMQIGISNALEGEAPNQSQNGESSSTPAAAPGPTSRAPSPEAAPGISATDSVDRLSTVSVNVQDDPSPSLSSTKERINNKLIEEIVVTAQKREENIQDVPVAISAFSGEQLAALGVNNTKDLTLVTPGLQFTETAGFTLVYLRGIGSDAFIPYADPSVATYIDGLYIPAQQGLINSFGGIERVEVLKGPQGTLFGRNSTGGAINVITKSPSQSVEVSAQQEVGNIGDRKTQVYASFPIVDSLAVSLSGIYSRMNPYYHNINSSCAICVDSPDGLHPEESKGGRVKVRWTPADNLDFTLAGYRLLQSGSGSTIAALSDPSLVARALGINSEQKDYEVHRNEPSLLRVNNTTFYGNGRWALPWFDLKLIGGHQHIVTPNAYYDYDGSNQPLVAFYTNHEYSDVDTAEFQVASNASSWNAEKFKWIGGLYYLHSVAGFDPLKLKVGGTGVPVLSGLGLLTPEQITQVTNALPLLGGIPGLDLSTASVNVNVYGVLETHSLSGFVQGNYDFTDWLGLTLGGRLQKEDRFLTEQRDTLAAADGSETLLFQYHAPKVTQSNFSPKASINLKPFEDVLVYLTAAKGYKSGTYNGLNIYTPPNYVQPEEVKSIELGFKSDFFNKTLRFNAAVFQNDIKNLQAVYVSLTNGGAITFENAASARSRGAEFDTVWIVFPEVDPGLALTAGMSYLDSTYTSYQHASGYNEQTGLFFSKTGDFTGNRIPRSPKTSGNLGLNQTLDLDSGTYEIGGDVYYNSGFFFTSQNTQAAKQGSYQLLNAHLSYQYVPWRLKFTAFGQNLADKKYRYSSFTEDFGTFVNLAPPRTYGLRLNWDY